MPDRYRVLVPTKWSFCRPKVAGTMRPSKSVTASLMKPNPRNRVELFDNSKLFGHVIFNYFSIGVIDVASRQTGHSAEVAE